MLLSTINFNRCGRWQKIRLISNAIGCCNFGTIPAGTRPNSSNMLVVKCCGCVHQIASSQLQLRQFNQTAAISSTTKTLTKAEATGQQTKPSSSRPININESQQQTQNNPETTEDEQQPKQQQNETDKPQHVKLAKASIAIGPSRNIEIECHQGTHRFIRISRLPNIRVPADAYKFVAALDRLIGQLPVEKPANSEENIGVQRILALQMLEKGVHYDFNLSIVWHQERRQWNLRIRSVQTSEKHKEREVHFPLWTLPQLRQQMATMLEEYDGTERIDEIPAIPEWVTREKAEEEDTEKNEENAQPELGPNERAVPQQQIETEMDQSKVLAKSSLPLGPTRKLHIDCPQGRKGHKTIRIYIQSEQPLKLPRTIYVNLPKIHVPKEAYKFVAAMDRLIGQLPVEAPANPPAADESPPILANQMVEGGIFYDFQLLVVWFERGRRWDLKICSVKTVTEHNEGAIGIPLCTLPWLRQKIAEILEEYDGTQRIDKMPTLPEWATLENNEGNGQTELGQNERPVPQQQIETEMDQTKVVKLPKSFLPLGPTRKLHIECQQGRSGHKTIQIHIHSEQKLKLPRTIYFFLAKIHVPEEAYTFVAAMDRLIGQLPVEAPANPPAANESPAILANQMVEGGIFYDFQLSVVWFEQGRRWDLKIHSVKTVKEHHEGGVQIPLWTLPWLRQEMATMLEKFDGTQRIDEMPTIPEWATQAPSIQLRIDKMPPMPEWAKQAPNIRLKS